MKTILITGANRGIGLSFCKQLKEKGHHIIAVCRRSSPELERLDIRIESNVDVTDEQSIANLAKNLNGVQLDILINNAGILSNETLEHMNFKQIVKQFEVNSLGPLRVTHALLPNLHEGSKVIIITSRMGSITDNTSGGRYGYRMSKAAINIAGVSLAHDLKKDGIAVALLHPGFVRTEMTGNNGLIDASESVKGLLQRIEELTLENTGGFWHTNGELLPW